jgi:hypothetical protein
MLEAIGLLLILLGGAAMIFTMRYKNEDPEAGHGIASWTIVIAILYLLRGFPEFTNKLLVMIGLI